MQILLNLEVPVTSRMSAVIWQLREQWVENDANQYKHTRRAHTWHCGEISARADLMFLVAIYLWMVQSK